MTIFRRISSLVIAAGVAIMPLPGLISCGRDHSQEKEHDGHTHNESLQLTAYSRDFEVFAEATPFVAGHDCEVLAHFTRLSDFKPLAAGKVTMKLLIGNEIQGVTLEKPSHPGIYSFEIKPKKTGKGSLIFSIESDGKKYSVEIPDITVYADEHEAHSKAAEMAAKSSNGVAFPKEQSWNVDFSTEEVVSEPFGEVIRTMAQVEPSMGDERVVVAKTSGTVRFASADLTEGKAVGSGQALFGIESDGLADNNMTVRYREAESAYNFAKGEYERKKELAKDKLVTQGDLQKAKADYESAEAAYGNLRRNFSAGRHSAASPISGFIKKVYVRNGEYVEAGSPVMEIAQNRDLYVKAELQPRKFHNLKNIVSTNFKIPGDDKVYSLKDLNGSLVSYGKSVDAENPLVPVVFKVNNTVDLLPGSFVEMFITTGTGEKVLTVPCASIVEEMGNYFVFVQLTPEFFEKREVKTGQSNGIRTEIRSGLKEGDRVVGKGAVLVKLAQASGKLDAHAGHVH